MIIPSTIKYCPLLLDYPVNICYLFNSFSITTTMSALETGYFSLLLTSPSKAISFFFKRSKSVFSYENAFLLFKTKSNRSSLNSF